MAKTLEEYWKYLDELGEEVVIANLAKGLYGGHHLKYVNGWLKRQNQRREDRKESSDSESLLTAKSAKDAAWASAEAASSSADSASEANTLAREANQMAKTANIIAILAAIVAAISAIIVLFSRG